MKTKPDQRLFSDNARGIIMSIEHFQNLIIGSGVAGQILAWTLASQGQQTVVVERAMVGGSCPNVACLPSKNVIYSAKAVSLVHPTKGLGVVTGPVRRSPMSHAEIRAPTAASALPAMMAWWKPCT